LSDDDGDDDNDSSCCGLVVVVVVLISKITYDSFPSQNASSKLDKTPESVEEFVDHLIFLSRMSSEINLLEREYTIVTRLYAIAKNFDMPIEAEELALSQTLMPSFMHLKVTALCICTNICVERFPL